MGYLQARAPQLLRNTALRTLLLAATLLDTGNLSGASVRIPMVVVAHLAPSLTAAPPPPSRGARSETWVLPPS